MSRIESRRILPVLLAALIGCATTKPKPLVPGFDVADRDPYGGWISTQMQQPKTPDIEGELIAVGPDRLYVLTATGGVEVPKASVKRATVTLYNPKTLFSYVGPAMLLALSNGVWATVTIPLWGVAGGIALHEVTMASELEYPPSSWESLNQGARFPQGLPNGVSVSKLRLRGTVSAPQK